MYHALALVSAVEELVAELELPPLPVELQESQVGQVAPPVALPVPELVISQGRIPEGKELEP